MQVINEEPRGETHENTPKGDNSQKTFEFNTVDTVSIKPIR